VNTEGIKHDAGKLRLDLIPPEAIRALGEVLTYGTNKYGDRNWEKGISEDRLYARPCFPRIAAGELNRYRF